MVVKSRSFSDPSQTLFWHLTWQRLANAALQWLRETLERCDIQFRIDASK